MMNGKIIYCSKGRVGACSLQKSTYYHTPSFAQAVLLEKTQKQSCTVTIAKNRSDTTGLSFDMEWNMCQGDTSVQIPHKLLDFMLETGHELDSHPQLR